MIQVQTISVTLKEEIIERIDDTVFAHLHFKTSENTSTLKKWIRYKKDKLTHYSFLIALSEIFNLPIENLVKRQRSKCEGIVKT